MNDPGNALLLALLRLSLLAQLMFYRAVLGLVKFIRGHKSVLVFVTWSAVVGPYVLFGLLLILIGLEVADWMGEG